MKIPRSVFFISIIPLTANAVTCPSGYTAYDRSLQLSLSTTCPSGTTNIGTIPSSCTLSKDCFPDMVCNAGFTDLKTSSGLTIPVYSTDSTSPSLRIALGGTTCHVPLVTGNATGAINIKYNNTQYKTMPLSQCRKNLNSATGGTAPTVASNNINWSVNLGSETFKGIAYCGNEGTTTFNLVKSSISTSNTLTDNIRCWCRIYSPFPSNWVYVNYFSTNGSTGCNSWCAQACANAFATNEATRTVTINTMY